LAGVGYFKGLRHRQQRIISWEWLNAKNVIDSIAR
jgi:hypothetical protein